MNNFILEAQNTAKLLYESHPKFKEKVLKRRRLVHADIVLLIEKLKSDKLFNVSIIGKSVENRDIFQIKIGTGPTKVLLWSQMHGDEPTATMAIFDIFNFFADNKNFVSFKKDILTNCTLYFVPMLNPDGAERFMRRNALGIDLNRDALQLRSPESVLLKKLQHELKPDFGFNLHDQSPRYTVGNTSNLAAISFLATAYNVARDINPIRLRSMQLIVSMNRVLQNFIPNLVGRFSDEFEPRAFGDNIQKWGTTLILIESGGYIGDNEKQYIRKLNFVSILSGLHAIAGKYYESDTVEAYNLIPENGKANFDIIIRNAKIKMAERNVIVDIGINIEQLPNSKKGFNVKTIIEDIGDLSTYYGTKEIDGKDSEIETYKHLKIGIIQKLKIFRGNKVEFYIKKGAVIK
jgi:Zinc carboxypeptidase